MEKIVNASEIASQQIGFREGITLVIDCGLGSASIFLGESAPQNWRIEYFSVPDALTMAWMEDFNPIDVWRILDSKGAVGAFEQCRANCLQQGGSFEVGGIRLEM